GGPALGARTAARPRRPGRVDQALRGRSHRRRVSEPPPPSLDRVTPEWLTAALAERHPGVVVRSVRVDTVLQCFATNVRLLLTSDDGSGPDHLPPTMFLKAGFGTDVLAPVFAAAFAREVAFYRDVAPEVPVNVPRC